MSAIWFLSSLFLSLGVYSDGISENITSRPSVVNIGALFSFDSTIGRVAKIAIEEAVNDVNSDSSVLHGTKLVVKMQNTNCSGFTGMVGALKIMETDVVAIIGPQSSVVAHVISDFADELKVPLVTFAATDPTLSSLQFPFLVRTTQSDFYQMAAIAEIVDYYGWREVVAIFVDDDFGRNGVATLDDTLAERRCRVSYKAKIPPGQALGQNDIIDILITVSMLESRVIVLHVNPDIGLKILGVANHLGMMGRGYVWIATDWLSSVLDSLSHLPAEIMDTAQGLLGLRHHTPDSHRTRDFLSRWNKLTGGSSGLNFYGLCAYDTVWLVAHAVDAFINQGGVISFSKDSEIHSAEGGHLNLRAMSIFDSGKFLLKHILRSNFVGLTGTIKFQSDGSRILPAFDIINVFGTGFQRVGYWSNYSGLSTLPPETLYTRPPNRSSVNQRLYSVIWPGQTTEEPRGWVFPSSGQKLRIGVPKRVSFKEFVSQVHGTNTLEGFCIDVFVSAVNLLPYPVPYQLIPFGDGHQNPNYTELVNMIITGRFDAVVGDFAIVTSRSKMVDYTQPYAASGLVVVVPYREVNSGAWTFLHPFTALMWFVTAGSFLVVGIVVWILEHRTNDDFRGPPVKQIKTVIWFSLSTLFFAHKENIVSTLGRLVLLIWLFVVLIINSSYTASMTSILTVKLLSSPIKGIQSLNKSHERIGYQVGSFAEGYLEELGISKSRLVPLGSPEAYARALELGPKNGGVSAVVDELPYVELFLSGKCKFRIVGKEFSRSGWGFAFPRDSPLAVDLSTAILALSENGDLQRLRDKWMTTSACTLETGEIEPNRLQLKSFWGLFLVCALACLAALLIHFLQVVRRFRHSTTAETTPTGESGSHLGRIRKILSIMDEKEDLSSRAYKRARTDQSPSGEHGNEV